MIEIPEPGRSSWVAVESPDDLVAAIHQLRQAGLTVRHVRGGRMRTTDGVFAEFAAAFQFPTYFGHNWHAMDECLADLEWLAVDRGVAVVISGGESVMADGDLADLVATLGYIADEWAETSEQGPGRDRPSMPVVVVVQLPPEDRTRWEAAGAAFA